MSTTGESSGQIAACALEAALGRVQAPIATAATLPPACYTDAGVFERERRAVFQRSWVGVGRTDRWKEPGSYTAITLAGVPIIVLRDRDGELRAFANTCRHRGARLLEGEGRCQTIRCPYHRWTYALDGRLLLAPRMEDVADFDGAANGLIPVRIESMDGFAFVCFDSDCPPLAQCLGDFSNMHKPWSLADMVSTRRREFEVACNWKSFIEVFNEYYHLPAVHPDSLAGFYDDPDDVDEVSGQYTSQFGTTQGNSALLEATQEHALPVIDSLADRNRHGTRYTWVYPNMTFAAGADSIWMYEVYPLSADRTLVGMTICYPKATAERDDFAAKAQHYYARFDAAIAEDIPALKNQHLGLDSPLARQGRFSPLEPSVANFACWYAKRMLDR
jgi:phenylpropionate dioxygenase-like ring-hydroxylating dioxygenase large terminal subunit